jgi:hypothetical protein
MPRKSQVSGWVKRATGQPRIFGVRSNVQDKPTDSPLLAEPGRSLNTSARAFGGTMFNVHGCLGQIFGGIWRG